MPAYTLAKSPMDVFKVTNQYHMSKNHTQWGKNKTHKTSGNSPFLCNAGWLHFYLDPFLASFFQPIHSNIDEPVLWTARAEDRILLENQIKGGCTKLTTIARTKLPQINTAKRIQFAATLCLQAKDDLELDEYWTNWLRTIVEKPGPPIPIPSREAYPPTPIAPLYHSARGIVQPYTETLQAADSVERLQRYYAHRKKTTLDLISIAHNFFQTDAKTLG